MKKTNNRGFSLVELIVVIAIMAVLIGVLAPQFLRYVDKARIQKDNTAIAEIANAAKIAMADEDVYNDLVKDCSSTIDISVNTSTNAITYSETGSEIETELAKTVGTSLTLGYSKYITTAPVITVKIENDIVKVSAKNMYKNDGTAESGPITY